MVIELESIGLHNPTRVRCGNIALETQGMSIEDLPRLWRRVFQVCRFEPLTLVANDKLYYTLCQKPLSAKKSIVDLFMEQGVAVMKHSDLFEEELWKIGH